MDFQNPLLLVAVAGAIGALARFAVGELSRLRLGLPGWSATLGVNVIGCLAIGWIVSRLTAGGDPDSASRWNALLVVGFCGSLTTFSSFALDLTLLWRQRRFLEWSLDLLLTSAGGLLAVWLGTRWGGGF